MSNPKDYWNQNKGSRFFETYALEQVVNSDAIRELALNDLLPGSYVSGAVAPTPAGNDGALQFNNLGVTDGVDELLFNAHRRVS